MWKLHIERQEIGRSTSKLVYEFATGHLHVKVIDVVDKL
jgi:hypothetical protein